MGLFDGNIEKRAFQKYQDIYKVLTSGGNSVDNDILTKNEIMNSTTKAILKMVVDFKIINEVLGLSNFGQTRRDISVQANNIIENLFLERARELLNEIGELKVLEKNEKNLNDYIMKKEDKTNYLKTEFERRREYLIKKKH